MDAAEKLQRDLDLLRKSRQALDEGELADRHASAPVPEERQERPRAGDADVVMYRGKPVRRMTRSGAPGAGRVASSRDIHSNTVQTVLQRLNGLYNDGHITKDEYDQKHRQILDRI